MISSSVSSLAAGGMLALVLVAASFGGEPVFQCVKIDGPRHDPANDTYWYGPFSEAACVLDMDCDGDPDIACGSNWYENPTWKKHEKFREHAPRVGCKYMNLGEIAMDVDRDGRADIVNAVNDGQGLSEGGGGVFWHRHPSNSTARWTSFRVHHERKTEGIIPGDIDGDGDTDILVVHNGTTLPQGGVTWLEHTDAEPWLVEHVVGTAGDMHGKGLGDLNGDGRVDILTRRGWYECPEQPTRTPWLLHDDVIFEVPQQTWLRDSSIPMLVTDVNADGLNDVIIGAAHNYGLVWFEQTLDEDGKRRFEIHWIERDRSQFHTMALADVNRDGKRDLVTGKCLLAHDGRDPGDWDPLFVFWYDIQHGRFERHVLSFGHVAWYENSTADQEPPNWAVGGGRMLNVEDLNDDRRLDVIVAGRSGLYVFFNQGPSPKTTPHLMQKQGEPTINILPQH